LCSPGIWDLISVAVSKYRKIKRFAYRALGESLIIAFRSCSRLTLWRKLQESRVDRHDNCARQPPVIPICFLGGAFFPVTAPPSWLQAIVGIDPLTCGADTLRYAVNWLHSCSLMLDLSVVLVSYGSGATTHPAG
jgi:hypothetical protein